MVVAKCRAKVCALCIAARCEYSSACLFLTTFNHLLRSHSFPGRRRPCISFSLSALIFSLQVFIVFASLSHNTLSRDPLSFFLFSSYSGYSPPCSVAPFYPSCPISHTPVTRVVIQYGTRFVVYPSYLPQPLRPLSCGLFSGLCVSAPLLSHLTCAFSLPTAALIQPTRLICIPHSQALGSYP